MIFNYKLIIVIMGFIILISIQYTLNRILKELRLIKSLLKEEDSRN